MMLFPVVILFVADVVAGSTIQCYSCIGRDAATCFSNQWNQTCALNRQSLGTTHCASVALKYQSGYSYFGDTSFDTGFFRGCFNCKDKKAACFTLAGYLKRKEGKTVQQCEIECCNSSHCNTQAFNLTRDAITVVGRDASGPEACRGCFARDAATCSERTDYYCSSYLSHCGTAVIKGQDDTFGYVKNGFFKGCINCADKTAACAFIGGNLKARGWGTLKECEIECCNSTLCNVDRGQVKCYHCLGTDAASCTENQVSYSCGSDSLGSSHCASAVGKYQDSSGNVRDVFYRGCIDCAEKKTACFTIGGYLKGARSHPGEVTLIQCEIECCIGNKCNTHVPTLSPKSVTVFRRSVSGPKQCITSCLHYAGGCFDGSRTQICASDKLSLGTTHCGSVVGKWEGSRGIGMLIGGGKRVLDVFYRGCINCADKKAACAAVGGLLKAQKGWKQRQCEIECCTGDNCNTYNAFKDGSTTLSTILSTQNASLTEAGLSTQTPTIQATLPIMGKQTAEKENKANFGLIFGLLFGLLVLVIFVFAVVFVITIKKLSRRNPANSQNFALVEHRTRLIST